LRKIIYYVATSVDGYISGPNDDISGFMATSESDGIKKYLEDLKSFDTVIMGRKTYESGYKFGLNPGEPAYPHMQHYIFSDTLKFKEQSKNVHVHKRDLNFIKKLKEQNGTDIYLCGGGIFAGWLLNHELIDILKIKLNPLLLGSGIRIFEETTKTINLKLLEQDSYSHGLELITYNIEYHTN